LGKVVGHGEKKGGILDNGAYRKLSGDDLIDQREIGRDEPGFGVGIVGVITEWGEGSEDFGASRTDVGTGVGERTPLRSRKRIPGEGKLIEVEKGSGSSSGVGVVEGLEEFRDGGCDVFLNRTLHLVFTVKV